MKDLHIYCFPSGATAVTDGGRQIPELQEPWILLLAQFLKAKGVDVASCTFYLPDQSLARLIAIEGGYRWESKPMQMAKNPECDFCSESLKGAMPRRYMGKNRISGMVNSETPEQYQTYKEDGQWLACKKCERLIDAGKFEELLCRAVAFTKGSEFFVAVADETLRDLWRAVFEWPV